jgi:hypothetical protein
METHENLLLPKIELLNVKRKWVSIRQLKENGGFRKKFELNLIRMTILNEGGQHVVIYNPK